MSGIRTVATFIVDETGEVQDFVACMEDKDGNLIAPERTERITPNGLRLLADLIEHETLMARINRDRVDGSSNVAVTDE